MWEPKDSGNDIYSFASYLLLWLLVLGIVTATRFGLRRPDQPGRPSTSVRCGTTYCAAVRFVYS